MVLTGPDMPTLCGEWTVRDLAAHLVIRERRPDSAPGILLSPLAGYTESVRRKAAEAPFDELVDKVRSGPPIWSPLRPVDALVNMTEMFVHHEDIRRGTAGWEPRTLDPADEAKLWSALKRMARMSYRSAKVGVILANPQGERITAKKTGNREVVLTGPASELLLHAFGRDQVRLDATGASDDVAAVLALDRSV